MSHIQHQSLLRNEVYTNEKWRVYIHPLEARVLEGVYKKYTTSISNYWIPETKQHSYMWYMSSGIPLILGV